jgi:hypothetical protein
MNESSVPSGWLLAAVFLLWGLAGALDQLPLDQEPNKVRPVEQAQPDPPPGRLLWYVDPDEAQARPPRSLRCFVIDE